MSVKNGLTFSWQKRMMLKVLDNFSSDDEDIIYGGCGYLASSHFLRLAFLFSSLCVPYNHQRFLQIEQLFPLQQPITHCKS